jgi:hypothetical protein
VEEKSSKSSKAWTRELIQKKLNTLKKIEAGEYVQEDGKGCGRLSSVIGASEWLLENLRESLLRLDEIYKYMDMINDEDDDEGTETTGDG